jgi:hypothetical protein
MRKRDANGSSTADLDSRSIDAVELSDGEFWIV